MRYHTDTVVYVSLYLHIILSLPESFMFTWSCYCLIVVFLINVMSFVKKS